MKHFFFTYDESFDLHKSLKEYANFKSDAVNNHVLKVYYDITDLIADKRFEQEDELLEKLAEIRRDIIASNKNKCDLEKEEYFRLQSLKTLWYIVEDQYQSYIIDCEGMFNRKAIDNKEAERQYQISIRLALYHLVRGNLCLRISQCYYENFDLEESDNWAGKGIEIFWHGKNLVAALRDSLVWDKRVQADLYLRLIKLNLAKYYRDYARKNRRSDFDAALDEFKQVRYRMEGEYEKTTDQGQKRQYVLIWMDAIINIAKIHRRKYQMGVSEQELLFLYSCLKDRLSKKDLEFYNAGNPDTGEYSMSELIDAADEAILRVAGHLDTTNESFLENDADLPELRRESFEKYDDLNLYDRRRYFLLVLLEIARIRRDLHFVENYKDALAIAIVADQWSRQLDKRKAYTPGHNMDALITISSSLRKYIKYQNPVNYEEPLLKEIVVQINKSKYQLEFWDSEKKKLYIADISSLIDKLNNFASKGHLKSKTEVMKWHCQYQQEPELLSGIKNKVGCPPYEKENSNCQLRFLNGLVALRSEKYDEAMGVFTELLENNKKEMRYIRLGTLGLKVRYLLANCYMARAEFAKAEKILRYLHDTLAAAKISRKSQGIEGSTDAETDARIEIDLGYCCMQRGAYEEAIEIYKGLYGDGGPLDGDPYFNQESVKQQRRIMGLNNYASSCIFSINDQKKENGKEENNGEAKKKADLKKKIETARRIFQYMDMEFSSQDNEKEIARYKWNPETNLLKGYYTLCTGIVPGIEPITDKQIEICMEISETSNPNIRNQALLQAFPYFRKACRFEEAFTSRYDLLDEQGRGNKARYRNEVERISVYIISLTKLQKLYLSKQETAGRLFGDDFKMTKQQLEYLMKSRRDLERFVLNFPANYKISLKAAIALAEWLLDFDKVVKQAGEKSKEERAKAERLQDQLYCSFSYVTIYEERGAGVFNALRDNSNFRFFTAAQRGRFCALLLAMYKPIKALKEECCFNMKDREHTSHLVHYTSMETLKKILTGDPLRVDPAMSLEECSNISDSEQTKSGIGRPTEKDAKPRFRINNCGYMNDVFEGKVFLKSISLISGAIESMKDSMQSQFVEEYFPQINRSDEDLFPSGSNVYIGSLSVKADSFPMWYGYSEKESGCNIEFGEDFFDIDGTPYLPSALRDYLLSKYTDQDYPLYIVQYIGSQFETYFKEYVKNEEHLKKDFETFHTHGHLQSCGTEAICYNDLFRILQQIYWRWEELDNYLKGDEFMDAVSGSKDVIRAFAADRINEIRFLFKDADYEYEGEVRVIYTDSAEDSAAKNNTESEVPVVYVDIERELKDLTIRLGSRIEDATVDKYATWLKHTKRVKKVGLAKQNRYTT